jgi:hypothetical protein
MLAGSDQRYAEGANAMNQGFVFTMILVPLLTAQVALADKPIRNHVAWTDTAGDPISSRTATLSVATAMIGLMNGWSFGAVGRQKSGMIAPFNESEGP